MLEKATLGQGKNGKPSGKATVQIAADTHLN